MDLQEKELSSIALAINVALDTLLVLLAAGFYVVSRQGLHRLWLLVLALLILKQISAVISVRIFSWAVPALSRLHRFLPDDLVVIFPIHARQGPMRVVKICELSFRDCWYPWALLAYAHVPRVHLLASYWNPCSKTRACGKECTAQLCRVHSGTPVEVVIEQGTANDLIASFKAAISADFALTALREAYVERRFAALLKPMHGLAGEDAFSTCLDEELTRIVRRATDRLLLEGEGDCGNLQLINAIVMACQQAKLPIWDVRIGFGNRLSSS